MGMQVAGSYRQTGQAARRKFRADGFGRASSSGKLPSILLVKGSEEYARAIRNALHNWSHERTEVRTTADATRVLAESPIDIVVLDAGQPQTGNLEFCRLLKRNPTTQFLPVYVLGSSQNEEEEIRALEAGADEFFVKPLRARSFQARIEATLRQKSRIDALDDSETVLFSLAQSVEGRDPDLGQHCHRLALMAASMGLALGLPNEDIVALQRGGYLHDVGKVAVPDKVLFKPGPLTESEWATMKTHAERGERICRGMKSLVAVLPIIRHHHERWDGSGYPDGLRGREIPVLARILQLADIFDALTTSRPYKLALTAEQALETIHDEAKKGWRDPELVETFTDLLPTFRAVPVPVDYTPVSLQALAATLDQFRKSAGQGANDARAMDFQLASGF